MKIATMNQALLVLIQANKYLNLLQQTYPTLAQLLSQYNIASLDEKDIARLIEQARIETRTAPFGEESRRALSDVERINMQ